MKDVKMAVEIYAEKPLNIKDGAYFKTALMSGGLIVEGSEGADSFNFPSVVISEKRVAGLGRDFTYTLASFPAGMGAIEARPGAYLNLAEIPEDIALSIETNVILDQGILTDVLGVRLIGAQGKSVDIPLCRPDVSIWWQGRGKFSIPIHGLLQSRILQAVS